MPYALLLTLAAVAAPVAPPPPPPPRPVQWEYTVVDAFGINPGQTQDFMGLRSEPTAKLLNVLGAQGWELVTAVRRNDSERTYFIFKRPIPPLTGER